MKERIGKPWRRREKKKREFLSRYPCLDFLAEPLKRAEIKMLALAHQRESESERESEI